MCVVCVCVLYTDRQTNMFSLAIAQNAIGKTVASTRVNGELAWPTDKVSKRTLMDASAMTVSGLMMNPFVLVNNKKEYIA